MSIFNLLREGARVQGGEPHVEVGQQPVGVGLSEGDSVGHFPLNLGSWGYGFRDHLTCQIPHLVPRFP